MRRLLLWTVVVLLLYFAWPIITEPQHTKEQSAIETLKTEITNIKDNPEFSSILDTIYTEFTLLISKLTNTLQESSEEELLVEPTKPKKSELAKPSNQTFAINNIEIGTSKEEVEQKLGMAKRTTLNEYGTEWHAYHNNYQDFIMISYNEDDSVNGIYTNQDLISSTIGIQKGSSMEDVKNHLGEGLNEIKKGNVYFQLPEDKEYGLYTMDESYITIFYDKHSNNTVTSIQIISKELEHEKETIYAPKSQQLVEGFEFQLFDITNATRVNHSLSILKWDDHVRGTARAHSEDMALNQYFDHVSLDGQSPFDRMLEDDLVFTVAGENLAAGQFSSIFAHEGLMNSLGHRENILKNEYEFLGIGVAFNSESLPYYTENFYR